MYRDRISHVCMIGLGLLLFIGTASVSAGMIDEIPQSLADSLGISTIAAEYILSACVLLSAGLALSMFKGSNMAATAIILLAMIGMLTAIGWLDAWLLITAVIVIALFFGEQLRSIVSSKGG